MKVKVTHALVHTEGNTTVTLLAGLIYDVSPKLGKELIENDYAFEIKTESAEGEPPPPAEDKRKRKVTE